MLFFAINFKSENHRFGQQNPRNLGLDKEGLAVASIARDVVEMTPPCNDNLYLYFWTFSLLFSYTTTG